MQELKAKEEKTQDWHHYHAHHNLQELHTIDQKQTRLGLSRYFAIISLLLIQVKGTIPAVNEPMFANAFKKRIRLLGCGMVDYIIAMVASGIRESTRQSKYGRREDKHPCNLCERSLDYPSEEWIGTPVTLYFIAGIRWYRTSTTMLFEVDYVWRKLRNLERGVQVFHLRSAIYLSVKVGGLLLLTEKVICGFL